MEETVYWIIFLSSISGPLFGLIGKWNWFFDFFSHFRIQQTFFLFITVLCLGFAGHFGKAAGATLVFSFCCYSLKNYFLKEEKAFPDAVFAFSVFIANIYAKNKQHEKVIDLIQKERPDIVVLFEVNETWEQSLKRIAEDYVESKIVPREGFYGMALFSKIPLESVHEKNLDSSQIPSLHCIFEAGRQKITLWATHPRSPRRLKNWRLRNQQLINLSKHIASDLQPTMVVGDLNTTPWCAWFKSLKTHRLRDSREGRGIRGTWSARLPFFMRIPLDHILISSEFHVLEHRILEKIGSDHLPVFARFGMINR